MCQTWITGACAFLVIIFFLTAETWQVKWELCVIVAVKWELCVVVVVKWELYVVVAVK